MTPFLDCHCLIIKQKIFSCQQGTNELNYQHDKAVRDVGRQFFVVEHRWLILFALISLSCLISIFSVIFGILIIFNRYFSVIFGILIIFSIKDLNVELLRKKLGFT